MDRETKLGSGGERGGGDLEDFLSDRGLAGLVVFEREFADEFGGVIFGGLHRDHASAVLGGFGGEDQLINVTVNEKRHQRFEHLRSAGLEQHFAIFRLSGAHCSGVSLGGRDDFLQAEEREHRTHDRLLDERVFETRINDFDRVDRAFQKLGDHELRGGFNFFKSDAIGHREIGDHGAVRAGDKLRALTTDHVKLGWRFNLGDEFEEIGVERAAEAFVGGDEQNAAGFDFALREKRMKRFIHAAAERREHIGHELSVGAAGQSGGLRLLHLGGGDELHRLGNLAGVFDRLDAAADVASGGHGG